MLHPRITLIQALCGPTCAGRRAGSPGGRAARTLILDAMREVGLDPFEQPVLGCRGANVLATIAGDDPRWIVVGAHYDHLGTDGKRTYWGADDNAAAVGVLVEVGRALAHERGGRGVILAAFDGEEPPYFATGGMGSQVFLADPPVPRASIDFMVCMDLVGHRFGPEGLPDDVGNSLFALGAERSTGTQAVVQSLKRAERDLVVRTADAEIIPPLSDYLPFWEAKIPFLFLSAGRSRVYHTPEDTFDKLDWQKIRATERWLTRFVRSARTRDDRLAFDEKGVGDAPTLDELCELLAMLEPFATEAVFAKKQVEHLRAACDRSGRLPESRRLEIAALVGALESRLA